MALILGWMLIAAGLLWALMGLWPAIAWFLHTVTPFLVALVVAYLFNPVVDVVQQRLRLGRIGGIVVVGVLILSIVVLFFGLLIPVLYGQAAGVVAALKIHLPGLIRKAAAWFDNVKTAEFLRGLEERVRSLDPQALAAKAGPLVPRLLEGGVDAFSVTASGIGRLFSAAAVFFATFVMVVVIAFYYLLEFGAIPRLVRQVLPSRIEDRAMDLLGKIDAAMGGYLRGQMIVCSLVAVIATIGLSAIGMYHYALLVGVIAGVMNLVPYLGPPCGAVPAILWALLASSHEGWLSKLVYAGLVVALFALIQALDGFVFQPRIVGKSSNLHPLLVMLALLIGAQFGLGGMIVAVPIACVGQVLFKELLWTPHCRRKDAARAER